MIFMKRMLSFSGLITREAGENFVTKCTHILYYVYQQLHVRSMSLLIKTHNDYQTLFTRVWLKPSF